MRRRAAFRKLPARAGWMALFVVREGDGEMDGRKRLMKIQGGPRKIQGGPRKNLTRPQKKSTRPQKNRTRLQKKRSGVQKKRSGVQKIRGGLQKKSTRPLFFRSRVLKMRS